MSFQMSIVRKRNYPLIMLRASVSSGQRSLIFDTGIPSIVQPGSRPAPGGHSNSSEESPRQMLVDMSRSIGSSEFLREKILFWNESSTVTPPGGLGSLKGPLDCVLGGYTPAKLVETQSFRHLASCTVFLPWANALLSLGH